MEPQTLKQLKAQRDFHMHEADRLTRLIDFAETNPKVMEFLEMAETAQEGQAQSSREGV